MSLGILQKSISSLRKKAKKGSDGDDDDEDEDEISSEDDSESSEEESSSDSDVKPAPSNKKERQNVPRKTTENRQKSSNIDLLLELENCECFQFYKLSFLIVPLRCIKRKFGYMNISTNISLDRKEKCIYVFFTFAELL